jgi:hypothetical protein
MLENKTLKAISAQQIFFLATISGREIKQFGGQILFYSKFEGFFGGCGLTHEKKPR